MMQVKQVHQAASTRGLVEEQFLRSLTSLPMPEMVERLSAKLGAVKQQTAKLISTPCDDEVRQLP
jgi:uncharacterized protein YidB (DUF937 family)